MGKPYGAEVATCPNCRKPVGNRHPYTWCVECGEPLPEQIKALIPELAESVSQPGSTSPERTQVRAPDRGPILPRLWSGEVPLAQAFWIWGFCLGGLFLFGVSIPFTFRATGLLFPLLVAVRLLSCLFYGGYSVFIARAILQSTYRYNGPRIWAALAPILAVLGGVFGVLYGLVTFVSSLAS